MPTECGFTGRPHDATGLVYMNARYYDPAIGQFISPDTIVPDPTVVMDYNRYAYARANPLKYNDPTGHFAACFQGSRATEADPNSTTQELCLSLAREGRLGGPIDGNGTIFRLFAKDEDDIQEAFAWVLDVASRHPDEPVNVIGYSWGGGAALELAYLLDEAGVQVDNMVTVEAVVSGRGERSQADVGFQPAVPFLREHSSAVLPGNVERALNLYAFRHDPLVFNGIENVQGALNIQMAEISVNSNGHLLSTAVNHHNIMNASNTGGIGSFGILWAQSGGGASFNRQTQNAVSAWFYMATRTGYH